MSESRFLFSDYAKTFTVTATTETASFEVENLLTDRPGNVWKSVGIGTQYITFNGTAALAVKAVIIVNHNIPSGNTLQLETSDDNFSSVDETVNFTLKERTYYTHDGTNETTNTRRDAYIIQSITRQDYRIKIAATGIAAYQIGRVLIVTEDYTVSIDFRHGYRGGIESQSTIIESSSGHVTKELNFQRYKYESEFPAAAQTQLATMKRISIHPSLVFFPFGVSGVLIFGTVETGLPTNIIDEKDEITMSFTELI